MPESSDIRGGKSGHSAWLLACLILSPLVCADQVKIVVLDIDGAPVADVAVYVEFAESQSLAPPANHAVMDQVDTRFDPHILIVQSGTEVRFPNSDVVAHHVYSFSNPNDFILPLYKGDAHAPVTFEESGVVTLGCNIHDQMLGYILIVDSNVFDKTDENGVAEFSVTDISAESVTIWSPRFGSREKSLSKIIPENYSGEIVFNLSSKLRPTHNSHSEVLQWSDY